MIEWFSNLPIFPKTYWIIAGISTTIFLVVIISTFLGLDSDAGDLETDIDSDFGSGFQFISFKNLVGFFTILGWSGITCIDAGLGKVLTVIISVLSGFLMMLIMATLFYFIYKLADSGTLNYKNAMSAFGEVYLTIGADRSSMGKVIVTVQGTMRELDAMTDSLVPLKSGALIKVVDVTSNGILIVSATKKPIEQLPIKKEIPKQLNS